MLYRNDGNRFNQRPPRNARSRNARPSAPDACVSRGASRHTRPQATSPRETTATAKKLVRMPTRSATLPNSGPTTLPATAAPNAVPIVWPRRSDGPAMVSQASAPANVAESRCPLEDSRRRQRDRAVGGGEHHARDREDDETAEHRPPLPDPHCDQTAADPADDRARAERPEQQAGLRLGEVVLLGVRRDERGDRAEQHRVDEHRGRDEEPEPPHPSRIRARKSAPSRWPPRPTSRLTAAEATADRRAINLGCSVLGARRNLHGSRCVSTLPESISSQNAGEIVGRRKRELELTVST